MTHLPPHLHRTGLPHSVLSTLRVLANGNDLTALQLVEQYKRNLLTMEREVLEASARELLAKKRFEAEGAKRQKAESKRATAAREAELELLA